jgi:hypothetical protein
VEIVALAFGLIGATLGVVNTWREHDRDRVKLRVTPAWAVPVGAMPFQDTTLGIEVVNHPGNPGGSQS